MHKKKLIPALLMFAWMGSAHVALAFDAPIPANTKHFTIQQAGYFDVLDQQAQPGHGSSFEVTVLKNNQWKYQWLAPIGNNNQQKTTSEGVWTVVPLKNGAFELKGFAHATIEGKNGKQVTHYDPYIKTLYPVKNKKNEYCFIAHLSNQQNDKIVAGKARFIFN